MSIAAGALKRGRRLAESLMDSTVIIRRKTGEELDPETGMIVPVWEVVYEGKARLRFPSAYVHEQDQAGQRFVEQTPTLWLPVEGTAHVRLDDEGEIVTAPFDVGQVGQGFRVTGPHLQTHSTSRRLPIEILTYAGGPNG